MKDKQELVSLIGRSAQDLMKESRMGYDSPEFRTLERRLPDSAKRGLVADRESGRLGFKLRNFLKRKLNG